MKENCLELYIHIPFCVGKCNYCDFVSAPGSAETIQKYADVLCREIQMMSDTENWATGFINRQFSISSIYIGGGTPSILSEGQMQQIIDTLKESFEDFGIGKLACKRFASYKKISGLLKYLKAAKNNTLELPADEKPIEFTIECNPGTVDIEKLKAYKKMGINRISFGLQSADATELKMLGRIHTFKCFLDSFEAAREAGFDNINVDLMQAIPGQTLNSWKRTLAAVASLSPEHISAYSLIIEEGTPFYEGLNQTTLCESQHIKEDKNRDYILLKDGTKGYLPSEDEEREIYYYTKEFLEKSGFHRYEISNYARAGFECRHNVGYWKRVDYLGLGLNSSSLVDNVRWKNTENLSEYLNFYNQPEALRTDLSENDVKEKLKGVKDEKTTNNIIKDVEKLSHKAQMEEFVFLGLRLSEGISKKQFFDEFGQDFDFTYGEVVRKHVLNGLLTDKDGYVKLTDKGVDVSNTVLADFLL